jgi:hypothetical protein
LHILHEIFAWKYIRFNVSNSMLFFTWGNALFVLFFFKKKNYFNIRLKRMYIWNLGGLAENH